MTQYNLTSNKIPIPISMIDELCDSSDLISNPQDLKERFYEEGCLLIRGLLPRESVLDIRETYFKSMPPEILMPCSMPRIGASSGIVPENIPPHGYPDHPAFELVRNKIFLDFANRAELRKLAELILGGPVRRLARTPLRHYYPNSGLASRAHTDFTFLDKGTTKNVTFWIPLGDCYIHSGPIIYLDHSHNLNIDKIRQKLNGRTDRSWDKRPLSHDLAYVASVTNRRWLCTSLNAGDVTIHHPFNIHASLDCQNSYMRLSTDIRFQLADDPVDPRWKFHWSGNDSY